MSYWKKIEYEIVLKDSLTVIRNCPGCGRKTRFVTTKKFRVNANGGKLDVWLIYQCEECRHTHNLTIYERRKVSSIPKEEYQCFLDNEERLVERYGRNMQLFQKNKESVDLESLSYDIVKRKEIADDDDSGEELVLVIHNPYGLKIRPEKQIAEVCGLSRSQTKSLLAEGKIRLDHSLAQILSVSMDADLICEDK